MLPTRWTVPLGIGAVVVAATSLIPALGAAAGTDLPDRTAEQLLTDLQGADVTALQGTVAIDTDLGLLSLPQTSQPGPHGSGIDLLGALDGRTTLRVWASAEGRRVALVDDLAEIDVVTDGSQSWVWSSEDQTVTHVLGPTEAELAEAPDGWADAQAHWAEADPAAALADLTPEELSAQVLAAVDESTEVTTGPQARVAGRAAYQLVLTPRDTGTLIASVTIAIDAAERVPTRVAVTSTATGQPALTVGFTDVSFSAPDAGLFTFTPPAGADVTERPWSDFVRSESHTDPDTTPNAAPPPPQVLGEGWTSVFAVTVAELGLLTSEPAPTSETSQTPGSESADLGAWVSALPEVSGDWGSGRLLTSDLFTVLFSDDGRVLLGAVDADTVIAAAGVVDSAESAAP